jgi:D-alanyl-lipoteichoic acid acyltransferase DltB (MBOAT superfamily)
VISSWLASVDLTADIIGPIGLSFAAFRAADLLIKSNLGLVDRLSPGRVFSYGLFAPLLVVGPIATYGEVGATIEERVALDRTRVIDGVLHLASGLVKIWVLALPLAWSTDIFRVADYNSAPQLWIALIAFGWYFYLNFAGYSDLAVGIARLMGGDVKENFDRPYFRTDPNAFWNSWHISLTRFLRTNVFTPIAAGRPNRQTFATMVTMLFIGLWHGIGVATLLFGLYHGISLVAHRRLQARRGVARNTGPVMHVLKSSAVFMWFTISLPMIELPFRELGPFYRTLLPG